MNHRGFSTLVTLLIVLGIVAAGGAAYVALNLKGVETATDISTTTSTQVQSADSTNTKSSIAWRFTNIPGSNDQPDNTNVTVVINGTSYDAGSFVGSCSELGANGGIDGKGLLAGELSAAQCWFAGSGNEIGVFAHEDGGFDILVGVLSEGEEGTGLFRGDFTGKYTIPL